MFNSYLPQNSKDAVFEGFSRSDRGGAKLGRAQIVPYLSVILRVSSGGTVPNFNLEDEPNHRTFGIHPLRSNPGTRTARWLSVIMQWVGDIGSQSSAQQLKENYGSIRAILGLH
jgi:hypothetical protein